MNLSGKNRLTCSRFSIGSRFRPYNWTADAYGSVASFRNRSLTFQKARLS
jgi:hypothetical protein